MLEAKDVRIRVDLTMEVPHVALEDSRVEERWEKPVNLVKVIWAEEQVTLPGNWRRI